MPRQLHCLIFELECEFPQSQALIVWLDENGNGRFTQPAHPDRASLNVRAGDVIRPLAAPKIETRTSPRARSGLQEIPLPPDLRFLARYDGETRPSDSKIEPFDVQNPTLSEDTLQRLPSSSKPALLKTRVRAHDTFEGASPSISPIL